MSDLLHGAGPDYVANLLATTQSKRPKKEAMDAIFNAMPTLEYLNSKGKIMLDGGADVRIPLEVAKNANAGFYSGYDVLPTTPTEHLTEARYEWKQAQSPVTVSGREADIQNRGEAAIINLVASKQKNTEKSLRDLISRKLHGASNASNEILSLATLIDATSTVGEINSTNKSYWQSYVDTGGIFPTVGIADWRTALNTLKNRGGNPDMIITTQTIHELYEAELSELVRYSSLEKGDIKFRDLQFGPASVRFDSNCASGVSYFLDSDVLHMFVHENRNFVYNDFVRPPDQDAKVSQFLVALALGTSNRRLLGKVTSQTAS